MHVTVTYCSTHNHSKTLAHVQIPPRVRIDIAAKLQQGVGMERVLDDIRDNVANELGREHWSQDKIYTTLDHSITLTA